MGIADFDIGQPLTTPEYPAMQGESGAAKAADPRRDGDQFVKPRRGVIVDFAVRFPNICTILVKIGARLPPAQGAKIFGHANVGIGQRSEEHTSELQSLMRITYAVFGLKKKNE